MINFLIVIIQALLCAFVAHEAVRIGNQYIEELDMSPNISAIICLIFGITGIITLALYAVIKVLIKRMVKH